MKSIVAGLQAGVATEQTYGLDEVFTGVMCTSAHLIRVFTCRGGYTRVDAGRGEEGGSS